MSGINPNSKNSKAYDEIVMFSKKSEQEIVDLVNNLKEENDLSRKEVAKNITASV